MNFNECGNLAGGVIECSFQEMYDFLVINTENTKRREELVSKLISFFDDPMIRQYTCRINSIYLDGSFCTKKEFPGDIDILALIDVENDQGYNLVFNQDLHKTVRSYAKDKFEIDFLVAGDSTSIPIGIPQYQEIVGSLKKNEQGWLSFFCKDRKGNSKAVVKLDIQGGALI